MTWQITNKEGNIFGVTTAQVLAHAIWNYNQKSSQGF